MPISFLNPWFWLGALAIAAPVWLHLRRKKQTGIVLFSALRFLDDHPEPRRSPMRLCHLLLLLLRMLALLCVVAAFAWPYLRRADTVPVKESRVYIFDNTLSRQVADGFTRDRQQILNALSQTGVDVQIAVIELTVTPKVVVAFGDDRATALHRIQELRPSFQRGAYLAAFRQAGALLANSLGLQKKIVFLTDNQANQWTENINTPPFLRNIDVILPKNSATALPNLAVGEPRAQRIFLGEKSLVNFTAKLNHQGEASAAKVLLRANDQVIFNRTVELEKQPATILLHAQWEADPATWLQGEITVDANPDSLSGDNHAYFSLAPVVEGKVALLAQSQYLRLALSPEIMRGQWATRTVEPAAVSSELTHEPDADLLFLESNYLQSSEVRKLLSRYLQAGHGVVLSINRISPAAKGFLRELGFDEGERVIPDRPETFQFVSYNHPIFHPFLSPDYGNLMEIKVSQYAALKATDAMPLIFSARGAGLLFQGTKFPGKLFVLAFALDREQTSWPVHPSFIPFLDQLLQSARAEDATPTAFEPGELALIPLPANTGATELVLRGGREELSRATVNSGKAQLRMPDKPGLYTVSYDRNQTVEKVFAVNPAPKESDLSYTDNTEGVKLWSTKTGPTTHAGIFNSLPASSKRAILQQHLWWWMVLAGLAALVLETIVAEIRQPIVPRRAARQSSGISGHFAEKEVT